MHNPGNSGGLKGSVWLKQKVPLAGLMCTIPLVIVLGAGFWYSWL